MIIKRNMETLQVKIIFTKNDLPVIAESNNDNDTFNLILEDVTFDELYEKMKTLFDDKANALNYKYALGSKVWVVYEVNGEVSVYDDILEYITVEKDKFYYVTKEGCHELAEDEVILYDDKEKLYKAICEKMNEIRKRGEE